MVDGEGLNRDGVNVHVAGDAVGSVIAGVVERHFGAWDASALVSPFASVAVPSWQPISRLLLAKYRVVPYVDVAGRLDDLHAWATRGPRVRVAVITGRGGAGKTRLASELAATLAVSETEPGWLVGLLREQSTAAAINTMFDGRRSVCVVVDYAEHRIAKVRDVLEAALLNVRKHPEMSVRVVLTIRTDHAVDARRLFASDHPDVDALLEQIFKVELNGTPDSTTFLFESCVKAFVHARDMFELPNPAHVPSKQEVHGSPLEILAQALLSVLPADERADTTARGALAEVLDHERRYWRQSTTNIGLGQVDEQLLARAVVLATVATGSGVGEDDIADALSRLKELLSDAGRRAGLARWFLGLYGSEGLGPDRLFELLVDETVRAYLPLGVLLLNPESAVVVSVLRVLARLSGDRVPSWLSDRFGGVVGGFVDRVLDDPVARDGVEPLTTLVSNLADVLGASHLEAMLSAAERINGKDAIGLQVALIDTVTALLSFVGEVPEDCGHVYRRAYPVLRSAADVCEAGHRFGELITVREAIVRLDRTVLGPDHPDTLGSRNNLAESYRSVGRYDDASVLQEQTLKDRLRVLGPDHANTLTTRNNLAESYRSVGRYEGASVLHEQTLSDRLRVLGPDHPHTLGSRNNLALSYQSVGRYDDAIVLHEQTLSDRLRVLGPDHPDTLGSRNNLANSYWWVGRYDDAIVLHEQTLKDRLRVLGPDHPDALTSRNNLAESYRSVGRYDDAIVLFEQTLKDRLRVLGPDHPDALTSRNNLAESYRSVGRDDDAIVLHEQTLSDLLRVLGPDHPATLTSRSNLALSYRSVGRYDDSIVLHEQTLTDRLRVLGPDHPDALTSRNNLAFSLWWVGRYDDAIVLFEQTLTDRLRVLGPDHPDTFGSRNNLAESYRSVGRYDDAIMLHEQTLTDRMRVLGPDHPDTLTSRSNLANAFRAVGRNADADRIDGSTP